MAISAVHFGLMRQLAQRIELSESGRVLEIGEANHYGDWNPDILEEDIAKIANRDRRQALLELLALYRNATHAGDKTMQWQICKFCYQVLFNAREIFSLDYHGTSAAIKYDLNFQAFEETVFPQCDLVYNHGTAEHVFNVANVFRFMHDATKVGGIMVHESPFTGWVDHGFYTLQPTLFYDVAAINDYEIILAAIEQTNPPRATMLERRERISELAMMGAIPLNAMLYIAFRRRYDLPFTIPTQGVYAGTVSEEVARAWKTLR